jgi:hypothetical protein
MSTVEEKPVPVRGARARVGQAVDALQLRRHEVRSLLAIAAVDSVGTGVYSAIAVLFFTRVKHFAPSSVALAFSLGSVAALVLTPNIGRLADRFGPLPTMILLFLVRAVGYGAYTLVGSYWQFLALTMALYVIDRAGPPIQQGIIGSIFAERDRATSLATMQAVRNVGIVLGSLLASIPLWLDDSAGYSIATLGNALSFVAAAALLYTLRGAVPDVKLNRPAPGERISHPARNPRFVAITAVNGLLFTHNTLLTVILPLWVVSHTHAPAWFLAVLLMLNAVLAIITQIPVARFAASTRTAVRAAGLAGIAIGVSCLVYAGSGVPDTAWAACLLLVVAMAAHTVGEVLHVSAAWQLSFAMSPERARVRYLTFFNLGRVGQDVLGPTLLVLVLLGPAVWPWLVVAVVVAAGGLLAGPVMRGART